MIEDTKVYYPFTPYGGRRFVLTVGAGVAYTVLLVMGILSEDAYVMLQMMTVGAYMGASSVQKYAQEKAKEGSSEH